MVSLADRDRGSSGGGERGGHEQDSACVSKRTLDRSAKMAQRENSKRLSNTFCAWCRRADKRRRVIIATRLKP